MSLSTTSVRQLIVIVLCVAALVAVASFFWKPATQPSPDAGQQVVAAFLTKVREGKPDQAWAATTAEFKSAQGQESFIRAVKSRPYLQQPMEFFAVNTVTIQNEPRSEYLFRAPDGNAKTNTRVVIGRENGEWKVDMCLFPE